MAHTGTEIIVVFYWMCRTIRRTLKMKTSLLLHRKWKRMSITKGDFNSSVFTSFVTHVGTCDQNLMFCLSNKFLGFLECLCGNSVRRILISCIWWVLKLNNCRVNRKGRFLNGLYIDPFCCCDFYLNRKILLNVSKRF